MVENGIFLLAYAKFASSDDEERELRVLRFGDKVKTDREVFQKEYDRALSNIAVRKANSREEEKRSKKER